MIRIAVFIVPTGTLRSPCGHIPGAESIRKKMYAEKSPPKSITSEARKSQMPIFAFQRPVSGRVEIVYGISIGQVRQGPVRREICGAFARRVPPVRSASCNRVRCLGDCIHKGRDTRPG